MGVHYITTPRVIPDGYRFITEEYTVIDDDRLLYITNDSTTAMDVTLIEASHFMDIKIITIQGAARLIAAGSDTINSASTYSISEGTLIRLVSDGTSK